MTPSRLDVGCSSAADDRPSMDRRRRPCNRVALVRYLRAQRGRESYGRPLDPRYGCQSLHAARQALGREGLTSITPPRHADFIPRTAAGDWGHSNGASTSPLWEVVAEGDGEVCCIRAMSIRAPSSDCSAPLSPQEELARFLTRLPSKRMKNAHHSRILLPSD